MVESVIPLHHLDNITLTLKQRYSHFLLFTLMGHNRNLYCVPIFDVSFSITDAEYEPVPGAATYKAMFQFEARNPDELSLTTGDIVYVSSVCHCNVLMFDQEKMRCPHT